MRETKEKVSENEKNTEKSKRDNQKKYCLEVDLLPDDANEKITWNRIDELMESTGEKLVTLARVLGYEDASSLSRTRPGRKRKPRKISVVNLIKLAKHFKVSTDYLLDLTEFQEPNHMKDSEQLEHIFYCIISLMLNFLPEDKRQPLMEKLMQDNK